MFDDNAVRTTLDIDPDVLQAAKDLAAARGTTAGKVLSKLARQALSPEAGHSGRHRHGVPVLPARPGTRPVTLETVNGLRDEAP